MGWKSEQARPNNCSKTKRLPGAEASANDLEGLEIWVNQTEGLVSQVDVSLGKILWCSV